MYTRHRVNVLMRVLSARAMHPLVFNAQLQLCQCVRVSSGQHASRVQQCPAASSCRVSSSFHLFSLCGRVVRSGTCTSFSLDWTRGIMPERVGIVEMVEAPGNSRVARDLRISSQFRECLPSRHTGKSFVNIVQYVRILQNTKI